MDNLAANFAAVGAHLASATSVVTVGDWSVGSFVDHRAGTCTAYLLHPTLTDPLNGQLVASGDAVRAYALARGYLRRYSPVEVYHPCHPLHRFYAGKEAP